MKKFFMLLTALMLAITANAQFEKGTKYAGASLSGLDLSYSGIKDLHIGVDAKAGYFVADEIMLFGEVGYDHDGDEGLNTLSLGVGGRYYMRANGIFLGVNANFIHANHNYNDVMPGLEVGYAFYISHTVTIEPSIYYKQSFKNHSDYSTIGLSVGFGIYL